MPAPDRVISEEHDALNPPVIPCFLNAVKPGRRLAGVTPMTGFEGFKIVPGSEGGFKVIRDQDFTLYILEDGYCEIPATKKNQQKLEKFLKPTQVFARKMQKVTDEAGGEIETAVRDPETGKVVYDTSKVLRTEEPVFRLAAGKRAFDSKKDSKVDYVRPWLRPFVSVPGAIMEPLELGA